MRKEKRDVYAEVTNRIIEQLTEGVVPWRKPWQDKGGMPKNLVSGKPYRGVNIWILQSQEYSSPWWVTFRQAKSLGGYVKSGEKGTTIVFWKFLTVTKTVEGGEHDGEEYQDTIPMARAYTVFNVSQCEKLKVPEEEQREPVSTEEAWKVLEAYQDGPAFASGYNKASYSPRTDTVMMPEPEQFESAEEYASTLYHEYIHSTGHESRLNRIRSTQFGDSEYSEEEVIAEMGASCLCEIAGVFQNTVENSAAYIRHWLGVLKEDSKFLFRVSSAAQKAVDMVTGK